MLNDAASYSRRKDVTFTQLQKPVSSHTDIYFTNMPLFLFQTNLLSLIIRPNCLKVDKAIILLKSYSKLAPRPAINIVNPETNNKKIFNHKWTFPLSCLVRNTNVLIAGCASLTFRNLVSYI